MNKSIKLLFAALLSVLLLAACSSNQSTSSSDNEESSSNSEETKEDQSGTLRVAFGMGESEWKVFENEIIPAFEQETGIKVSPIAIESDNLINKLTAEVDSGNFSVDMFAQDVNNLSALVDRDLVEDLSDYKSEIPDSVISGMVDVSTFEDQLLFMPYRPNVEIAFYNQKKFDKYGMKPPENWDELLQTAKTFKEKEGQGRVAMKANLGGDNVLHMFDFIRQAGGDPYVLNDEGSIKAFTFMQELYPYLAEQSSKATWDTMNQYLEKDSVYLGQNWPFYIPQFHEHGKDEIKAYSGWSGPEKEAHTLGGEVIGIPKGSKKVDEAMQFAQFLMSKEVQELLVSELAWPSVRSDAYGSVQGYQKPYFEAIKKALEHAEPRGNVPYWGDAESIYTEAFQKIVVEGGDVEENLNTAAEQLQKLQNQ